MFNVIDKYRNGRTTSELYGTSGKSRYITLSDHARNVIITK